MSDPRLPASLASFWKDLQSQMCVWHDVLWNKFLILWACVICGLRAHQLRCSLVFQLCFYLCQDVAPLIIFLGFSDAPSFIREIYWQMDFQMFWVSFAAREKKHVLKVSPGQHWRRFYLLRRGECTHMWIVCIIQTHRPDEAGSRSFRGCWVSNQQSFLLCVKLTELLSLQQGQKSVS